MPSLPDQEARLPFASTTDDTAGKPIQVDDAQRQSLDPLNKIEALEGSEEALSATATEEARKSADIKNKHGKSTKKRRRDIHWVFPFTMFSLLLFGILTSIDHHVYYESLAGTVVESENDQKSTYGSVFNFN